MWLKRRYWSTTLTRKKSTINKKNLANAKNDYKSNFPTLMRRRKNGRAQMGNGLAMQQEPSERKEYAVRQYIIPLPENSTNK